MFNSKCLLIFYQNLKYVQLICKTKKNYPENFIVSHPYNRCACIFAKNIFKNQNPGIITSLVYVQTFMKNVGRDTRNKRVPYMTLIVFFLYIMFVYDH